MTKRGATWTTVFEHDQKGFVCFDIGGAVANVEMSKYRKPLTMLLGQIWASRLPDWQRGIAAPVKRAREDSTFTNSTAFARTGRVFHALLTFSSKWPGAFTADLLVAPSLEPLAEPIAHRGPDDLPSLPGGTYRIGHFVAGRDLWWRVVDDEAESQRFLASIPCVDAPVPPTPRHPNHWYAPSYDVPLSAIMQQAAENFTETFERYVCPHVTSDKI